MDLGSLKPAEGSIKKGKRIGRGTGSGRGGTSTKGHNGAQSRSGYKSKIGFEGGQLPLYRRVPKFGFKNINRVEYQAVNLGRIQELADNAGVSSIDMAILIENGIVGKNQRVKILGDGELNAKIEVSAHAFSAAAKKAIEDKGGAANII